MTRTAVAGVLGLLAVTWYAWPTETRAIRARITTLVEAAGRTENESDLARIARMAALHSAVTPDVIVSLDDRRRLDGREAVMAAARTFLQSRGHRQIELSHTAIEIRPDRTAVADVTLRVDNESYHDVRMHLVKQGGEWLLSRADVQQSLVRPAAAPPPP